MCRVTAEVYDATDATLLEEFDRQVANLLGKGYPELAGQTEQRFLRHVWPLRAELGRVAVTAEGHAPFVLVVDAELAPPVEAVARLRLGDNAGFTDMTAEDLSRFGPIAGVDPPDRPVYLATDLDTGTGLLNVTPENALPVIDAAGRSPLTVSEGIALVTHRPDLLRKNACFSLLGSRCGDRRVTALWISKGRPRLGWCFAGAPHTWLGSASCGARLG
jgi:hypothetical protein